MRGTSVILLAASTLAALPSAALADPARDHEIAEAAQRPAWCAHSIRVCRDRPVFFDVGMITRRFTLPAAAMSAFRTMMPPGTAPLSDTAITGDLRFGARVSHAMFVAVEAEFGKLATDGSNVAGAYLVAGAQGTVGPMRLAAELAAGERTVRYYLSENDLNKFVLEPRVRAELWLSPQLSLGATAGSTLGTLPVWMAGLYVGVHSASLDGY